MASPLSMNVPEERFDVLKSLSDQHRDRFLVWYICTYGIFGLVHSYGKEGWIQSFPTTSSSFDTNSLRNVKFVFKTIKWDKWFSSP